MGSDEVSEKLKSALAVLLQAFGYSQETSGERWEFAVEIRRLRELGLDRNDLRWLVRKAFVKHAREVTVPGDDGREFRSTGDLTFSRRTCFVLTEEGVSEARFVADNQATSADDGNLFSKGNGHFIRCPMPRWDAETRVLHLDGQIVKRFKWQAANQELVLTAFQEEGWPARIDDPLPLRPEQDPKRRLSDTIKCLNRKQTNELIHFRGDGTGEGVNWEFVGQEGSHDRPSS